ncbi:MAG: DNA-binding protein [Saprospiraceae bacterium]|nr:DNA-binding protein [Saprospiraceae bacterium]
MTYQSKSNRDIANLLNDIANLLEMQDANPHRIRAYRRAANIILQRAENLSDVVAGGDGVALESIPGIGESLARTIEEYVKTGKSQQLQRLMGEVAPKEVFEQVPGIGPDLAERIVHELGIKTLEELEQAAHDGKLRKVEGFGSKRVEAIQMSLAGMLSGFARRSVMRTVPQVKPQSYRPEIAQLLEVDKEYRQKVSAGELKRIAPKRFNPDNETWLPIYHVEKGNWTFTTLFSNTARAHKLNKTNDWVILFYEKNGKEDQATVVTETSGPLEGRRVVRGREEECKRYYEVSNMNHLPVVSLTRLPARV